MIMYRQYKPLENDPWYVFMTFYLYFVVECIRTPRDSSCFVWSDYCSFWSVIYTHTQSNLFEHVILKSVEYKWMEKLHLLKGGRIKKC